MPSFRRREQPQLWADGSNWPRWLLRPTLERGDLARIVVQALLVRLPDHDVQATDDVAVVTAPTGDVLQARLGSIHGTLARLPPEERLRHFEPFLKALLETVSNLRTGTRPIRRNRLVPLVRDNRYFGDGNVAAAEACVDQFVGGLLVVYAWAGPNAFDIVTMDERRALKLSPVRLRELAVRNLRRTLSSVERRRFGTIWAVATGGQLEPSLLLVDECCEQFAAEVEGDLIACVPSNETFLYTGTGVDGGVEHLQRMAARLAAPQRSATTAARALLRWTGGRWIEHLPPSGLN